MPATKHSAYIGLGSNLQEPAAQLVKALAALASTPDLALEACSKVYQSAPLAGGGQQDDYLNAVVKLSTTLSPWQLLRLIQRLEDEQGRKRERHWGPRTLDLDILLFGRRCLSDPLLHIPHPGIYMRRFVLQPLADISPALIFPDGSSVQTRLKQCPGSPLQIVDIDEFKLP